MRIIVCRIYIYSYVIYICFTHILLYLLYIGNLIGAVISALMKTNMLVTHHNTGYTHIELWSHCSSHTNIDNTSGRANLQEQRIPCIQFINRIQHLTDHTITNNNTINNTTINNDDMNKLICGADTFNDHWIQEFDESII